MSKRLFSPFASASLASVLIFTSVHSTYRHSPPLDIPGAYDADALLEKRLGDSPPHKYSSSNSSLLAGGGPLERFDSDETVDALSAPRTPTFSGSGKSPGRLGAVRSRAGKAETGSLDDSAATYPFNSSCGFDDSGAGEAGLPMVYDDEGVFLSDLAKYPKAQERYESAKAYIGGNLKLSLTLWRQGEISDVAAPEDQLMYQYVKKIFSGHIPFDDSGTDPADDSFSCLCFSAYFESLNEYKSLEINYQDKHQELVARLSLLELKPLEEVEAIFKGILWQKLFENQ